MSARRRAAAAHGRRDRCETCESLQRCTAIKSLQEEPMSAAKKAPRGRKQDGARVAGGQKYEVAYEAK